jgi:hypothetical protein
MLITSDAEYYRLDRILARKNPTDRDYDRILAAVTHYESMHPEVALHGEWCHA